MGSGKSAESSGSALCSAPLENLTGSAFRGSFWKRMDRLFRHIADSTTVSVVQALDPRFQLTEKEYARLSQEEVSVIEKENGETLIAWEAELPYNVKILGKQSWSLKQRKIFPEATMWGWMEKKAGYIGEKNKFQNVRTWK